MKDIDIHIEEIPDGSSKLYVYPRGSRYENGGKFIAIMIVSPVEGEPDAVLIHGAKGHLTDEINVEIGLALRERGYRTAHIEVEHGRRVSRRAEHTGQDGAIDKHRIDLMQEI